MAKLFLFFYLMNVNYSCSSSHPNMHNVNDTVFQIDFQDFFSRDFVELKVNNCNIFADTLSSDKSDGFTDMRINAYLKKKETYLIECKNKSVECGSEKDGLDLIVILNGYQNRFKIDFKKGIYIGFSKKSKSEVYITQSIKPFVYD